LQQFELRLGPFAVVLARALEVRVHLLDVCHQVRKPRALERERLVLVDKSSLDTLRPGISWQKRQ
jgi:hypothetical protein